jgi:hypothetical protein
MLFLINDYAFVAQQVERTAVNRDVGGSSPPESVSRIWSSKPFYSSFILVLYAA